MVERDNDCSHSVVLAEDELLGLAALQRIDQAIELSHSVSDGPQFFV